MERKTRTLEKFPYSMLMMMSPVVAIKNGPAGSKKKDSSVYSNPDYEIRKLALSDIVLTTKKHFTSMKNELL
ncbi:hypothetical protein LIER_22073 [Lithospermum erythrorhizon]|uniref:Uncharacterized protein n=1 Tax=Lithospermum erythrorhizon TaxID=34254 RepID=A0AAV3QUU0_LITER